MLFSDSAARHRRPLFSNTPPPTPCLWIWFAGGSLGYASGDWNEEIYTTHVGVEYDCGGDTHAILLEVGYTEKDSDIDHFKQDIGGPPDYFLVYTETKIIPITLNYKINSSFELFGGVRYIYMADASLSGVNDSDDHATLDGDLHFESSGRYKF